MGLEGKRVIILVEDQYQDLEVWYPVLRLKEENAQVLIVGTGTKKTYKGKYGYPVEIDIDIGRIKIDDLDAIIIPGGWAPDFLRRHQQVVLLVREAFRLGKIIAAICHGPSLLVSAQVLQNKTVTCFMSIKDDVENAGAKFEDKEVVVDGNLITSRKPEDLPRFCKEIIKKLE
ncbi:type 1 glutamine amidotransferase [bacterium]|nr:type 1 glutamine amidotransferase [bacterium]